jgi:sulfatase modifying factor 1
MQALKHLLIVCKKAFFACFCVCAFFGLVFLIAFVGFENRSEPLPSRKGFQIPISRPVGLGVGDDGESGNRLYFNDSIVTVDGQYEAQEKVPAGASLDVRIHGGAVMSFHYCPPGSFMMGSPMDETGRDTSENQVFVTISRGFWMAETEVTQDQWNRVMDGNNNRFKGGNLPVERVNWFDAEEMARKLNEAVQPLKGFVFALPTEAQWEYACRAGTQTAFAFGHGLSEQKANYWLSGSQPVSVRKFPPNDWGLYDMHGNVWEWCADWYGAQLQAGVDPKGIPVGVLRVIRGGGWKSPLWQCRSAERSGDAPKLRVGGLGFRLAVVKSE